MLEGATILITGGTGSFGQRCAWELIKKYKPGKVIIFSRDELKQSEMAPQPCFSSKSLRFFLGDVRDRNRLERAMAGVDYVIHAAALKQVPAAEYNPHEFIKTNINGAMNVVDAALSAKVKQVIALSTDKAVNPVNLYGATKLCSDKIFIAGNSYSGKQETRFSVVRYGNVVGSRGSVIPIFLQQKKEGTITVTKPEMTRFLITIGNGVKFALRSLNDMTGGEIFIPKMPSCSLGDLAKAIAPDCEMEIVGLRPGEKLHESLVPTDEALYTVEQKDRFIIHPSLPYWEYKPKEHRGRKCEEGFGYDSFNNPDRLSIPQIAELVTQFQESKLV